MEKGGVNCAVLVLVYGKGAFMTSVFVTSCYNVKYLRQSDERYTLFEARGP